MAMANKDKHVVLKYSLAKALMDAGIHHLDGGGVISASGGNPLSGIAGALTTQNNYSANAPDMNAVVAGQNDLANGLKTEAAGGGPNPAQIQYLNNSNQIAQQQAQVNAQNRALNPAIAARLSGNEATAATQQAASGAAAQQAQQQIAAQDQLSKLYAQQQNASTAANAINAQVSQNNTNSVNQTSGGILSGIGSAAGGPFASILGGLNKGGEVGEHLKKMAMIYHPKKFASGGSVVTPGVPTFSNVNDLRDTGSGSGAKPSPQSPADAVTASPQVGDISSHAQDLAGIQGGGAAGGIDFGDAAGAAMLMKDGGQIPGKPQFNGNNKKNDVVPALLSKEEVVLPNSITQAPDAPSKAAEFMRSIQKKDGKEEDSGYKKVVDAKKSLKDRVAHLERLCMGGSA